MADNYRLEELFRKAMEEKKLIPGERFCHSALNVDKKLREALAAVYTEKLQADKTELKNFAGKCFGAALLLRLMAIDEMKNIETLSEDEIGQVIGSYEGADTFSAVFDGIPSLKPTGAVIAEALGTLAEAEMPTTPEAIREFLSYCYDAGITFFEEFPKLQ